jgi:hypothetical protein
MSHIFWNTAQSGFINHGGAGRHFFLFARPAKKAEGAGAALKR